MSQSLKKNALLFVVLLNMLAPISLLGARRSSLDSPIDLENLKLKITQCPLWMLRQIEQDLAPFRNRPLSLDDMEHYFRECAEKHAIVKLTIKNGVVHIKPKDAWGWDYRLNAFIDSFRYLSKIVSLPNVTFYISVFDALWQEFDYPIFAMAKDKKVNSVILIPDFEAMRGKFQVIIDKDIRKYSYGWSQKKPQLVWRGSAAQRSMESRELMFREDNLDQFSRVRLCQLSNEFPKFIDAKFTFLAQNAQNIPAFKQWMGPQISYEDQLQYKYHIMIDGNTCPYTCSGWKLFTNSVVFKPDSPDIQWYTQEMIPWVHYIPVKRNLEDLVEKIYWAMVHDEKCRELADNMRRFALHHIDVDDSLAYLYHLICNYSQLTFIH